ncbi:uncharacterized protein LOC125639862 isoform X1 [Caretta caretta]|uniref:uncharacterized protein LOC125639862 isoform X1 n=1 Tax=Caretta caretta TaxID=8467 RepID=UPI002095995A|nr:uncharacterized protein LOC125639862 isoform X1 [Caretta caretta]XP_048713591.1 uncharacterized protein LOC125639862 isoform X1 [Caretta caretta]XP_048713592.1 uncharacterized protein LOC125639862 isoform X1 [Caretta caretta]
MFSWHKSFTLGAPWRKAGKMNPPSKGKVVLTNMKILSNEGSQTQGLTREPPAAMDFAAESRLPKVDILLECQGNLGTSDTSAKPEYVATLSDLSTLESKCQLHRFSKFESEDSGVELPSGANSPSTPTGSEKSFVLHTRDSSCDSGVLSTSSSPGTDHVTMRKCKDIREASQCASESEKQVEYYSQAADVVQIPTASLEVFRDCQEGESPNKLFGQSEGQYLEEKPRKEIDLSIKVTPPAAAPIEKQRPTTNHYKETFGSMQDLQLHGHQLKKYPTSDSLDEYMDECCRLSEVNQGNTKALSSGLGYLEHICQLIEKIGQLQEHNLRLQKQVCGLQKERKMSQIKEEYFLQHCSCGAASILLNSYQEVKKFFTGRSRPHSLLIQSGNQSDLSIIPERGSDTHLESGDRQLVLGLRKTWHKRSNEENDLRDAYNLTDGQAFLLKDPTTKKGADLGKSIPGESHAWGRMKDLMKKTRLRNQSKLGLSSAALKRSCPQLYRPDVMTSDQKKTERNSMIVLGQSTKNEKIWSF